jgi:DNA-binding GntR family transcriptional regulator
MRYKILAGEIESGTVLIQEDIAKQLGVSRMPVREALQEMEQEGFLERLANRRIRVAKIGEKEIIQNLRILSVLEKELIIMIMQDSDLVEKLLLYYEKSPLNNLQGKEDNYIDEIINLHKLYSELLENNSLHQIHSRLVEGYLGYYFTKNKSMELKKYGDLIKEIIMNIQKKDIFTISSLIDKYYEDIIKNKEEK